MPRKPPKRKASPTVPSSNLGSTGETSMPPRKSPRASPSSDAQKNNSFLYKTYVMINDCDPSIASWTDDGEMIEIRNQERFEKEVIPENFNHSNFSSFARQLNFYGFNKVPSRDLRKKDNDGGNGGGGGGGGDDPCDNNNNNNNNNNARNYVTFQNEYFKRDQPELMSSIKRSTKNPVGSDQQGEIDYLKNELAEMKDEMKRMTGTFDRLIQEMSNEFHSRIEKIKSEYSGNVSNFSTNTSSTNKNHFAYFEDRCRSRSLELAIDDAAKEGLENRTGV